MSKVDLVRHSLYRLNLRGMIGKLLVEHLHTAVSSDLYTEAEVQAILDELHHRVDRHNFPKDSFSDMCRFIIEES